MALAPKEKDAVADAGGGGGGGDDGHDSDSGASTLDYRLLTEARGGGLNWHSASFSAAQLKLPLYPCNLM